MFPFIKKCCYKCVIVIWRLSNIPQTLLSYILHQGRSRFHHPQTLENPAGFTSHQAFCYSKAFSSILGWKLKRASYIKVPEGEDGDNRGRRGPAFAVGAVEDEGRVRVLGQGALYGLQELIKILKPRSHVQVNAVFSIYTSSKWSIRNRSGKRQLN